MPGPITDERFKSVAQGGLGLSKYQFYSPRNGFAFFPSQPHPPGNASDTIQQHPYPRDPGDPIQCEQMPDPPGNSG